MVDKTCDIEIKSDGPMFVLSDEGILPVHTQHEAYVAGAGNAELAVFDTADEAREYLTPSAEWNPINPVIYKTIVYNY